LEFLAVAILVLLQRYWSGPLPLSGSINVTEWLAFAARLPGSEMLIYVVSVFVPAFIVWLISNSISDTLLGILYFFVCIGVLMACIDRVDIAVLFDQAHQELNLLDDEPDTVALESRFSDIALMQQRQLHLDVTIYLFWCLLFGPAGAILCLFNRVFCDQLESDSQHDDKVGIEAEQNSALPLRVQYWLEWPSARINIMIMMLVGQFNTGWSIFTESLVDFQTDALHWLVLAYHSGVSRQTSDSLEDFKAQQVVYLEECEQFFNRQCMGWIGFAAVFAIFE
jgi:membrane protein required for beta-lactamase induction